MTIKEIIDRAALWASENSERITEDVRAFARIPSVSRADLAAEGMPFGEDCAKMLAFALEKGGEYGFETENHEGYCGSVFYGDRENAIGMFGHLDVVPEGDKWIYPPYEATRAGDFLIGRGVSDNKSACVMALHALRFFRESGIPLRHGLRAVLGCSEETGMQDMLHFVQTQTMPVVSLVPDASFPANYAQKGMMRGLVSIAAGDGIVSITGGEVPNMVPPHCEAVLRVPFDKASSAIRRDGVTCAPCPQGTLIAANGVAAHAASPESGRSAIHMLACAIDDADILRGDSAKAIHAVREMSSDYTGARAGIACEDAESGKTTMVIGVARTTDAGRIALNLDCRLSIATDLNQVERAYRAYCGEWGFTIEQLKVSAPFYMAKDDPRIEALMRVYREATGRDDPAYTMGGGTYSRELKNAVTFGIGFPEGSPRPADLPAHHGGAHAPDEFLYLPNLVKALPIYVAAIMELDKIV